MDDDVDEGDVSISLDEEVVRDPKPMITLKSEDCILHRAIVKGYQAAVARLVETLSEEERKAHDHRGNSALHLAVMCQQHSIIQVLIDERYRIPLMTLNA